MKTKAIVRLVVALGLVVLLGSCLIEGGDSADTGSLRIALPTIVSSEISDGVDTVRIWLYTPSSLEYGVDGGAARLPSAADNFLEAAITTSGGAVVIDGIPAGTGYRLVIVLGTIDDDNDGAFIPIDVAESDEFGVTGGRETALSLTAAEVVGMTYTLEGESLNSVVVGDVIGTNDVFTASSTTVFVDPMGTVDTHSFAADINSVSLGYYYNGTLYRSVYVNTEDGLYPGYGVGLTFDSGFATSFSAIGGVVDSGAFFLSDTSETVVYYERLGGLGGAVLTDMSVTPSWNDSGDDLDEYVAEDENPVRSAATNGADAAYIASVLGTFEVTEQYFEGGFDAGSIISGDDDAGLTFWGVAYPGADQALRITQIGTFGDTIVVGTARGAFAFPESELDGDLVGGLIPEAEVTQLSAVADEAILDLAVGDDYLAFLTARSLVVVEEDGDSYPSVFSKPLRAVVLGAPTDLFVVEEGGEPVVYISGAEGLTRVVE